MPNSPVILLVCAACVAFASSNSVLRQSPNKNPIVRHHKSAAALTSSFAVDVKGGVEFKLGSREIGHVHGDSLADVPLPKRDRDELVASGQAEPHHVLPQSGWVSFYIKAPADIDRAIGLLRRSYDLAVSRKSSTKSS